MMHHRIEIDDNVHDSFLNGIVHPANGSALDSECQKRQEERKVEGLKDTGSIVEVSSRSERIFGESVWSHAGSGSAANRNATGRNKATEAMYSHCSIKPAIGCKLDGVG
jgi:hypothetical protein